MSIRVVADNYVREGALEEFLAIAKELVESTHAKDKGCIEYALCQDLNDPLHLTMLEEWEDSDTLDAHMKSEHFQTLIPKLGALKAEGPGGPPTIYKKVF